ncbi:MAG: thrombospondin type 3 repeat-containing protein [Nitrososphaeraceae archaeon]
MISTLQDSDGAAISSTPFNAAPSQALDLELEFGDEEDGTMPIDTDGDDVSDDTDNCLEIPNLRQTDTDGNGVGNACYNCPDTSNPDQTDANENGVGDACETEPTPTCEECFDPLLDFPGLASSVVGEPTDMEGIERISAYAHTREYAHYYLHYIYIAIPSDSID